MPGKVTVDISDTLLDAFWHDPLGDPMREINRRANNIQSAIKIAAPRRTGKLAASVRKQPPTVGRAAQTISVQIDIGSDSQTPYLGYVLDGTRPHIIVPKGTHYRTTGAIKVNRKTGRVRRGKVRVTTRALRFTTGGGVIFRTRVFHPGTRANDFIDRGLKIGFEQ